MSGTGGVSREQPIQTGGGEQRVGGGASLNNLTPANAAATGAAAMPAQAKSLTKADFQNMDRQQALEKLHANLETLPKPGVKDIISELFGGARAQEKREARTAAYNAFQEVYRATSKYDTKLELKDLKKALTTDANDIRKEIRGLQKSLSKEHASLQEFKDIEGLAKGTITKETLDTIKQKREDAYSKIAQTPQGREAIRDMLREKLQNAHQKCVTISKVAEERAEELAKKINYTQSGSDLNDRVATAMHSDKELVDPDKGLYIGLTTSANDLGIKLRGLAGTALNEQMKNPDEFNKQRKAIQDLAENGLKNINKIDDENTKKYEQCMSEIEPYLPIDPQFLPDQHEGD